MGRLSRNSLRKRGYKAGLLLLLLLPFYVWERKVVFSSAPVFEATPFCPLVIFAHNLLTAAAIFLFAVFYSSSVRGPRFSLEVPFYRVYRSTIEHPRLFSAFLGASVVSTTLLVWARPSRPEIWLWCLPIAAMEAGALYFASLAGFFGRSREMAKVSLVLLVSAFVETAIIRLL